ncbi:hypothetical protein TNCV_3957221 [Trichonephila clavipes]|nr:hypothetical protein TNCV_3957221 [Trichonephila clavipes]
MLMSGNVNINAHFYTDDILDAYVRPYAGEIGDASGLQDNNARPHRASWMLILTMKEFIMQWSARSPDLKETWDPLSKLLYLRI